MQNDQIATTSLAAPVCNGMGKHVLLITPPWRFKSGNVWDNVASCYPSLGLGMIASYLEHCAVRVTLVDMQAEGGTLSQFEKLEKPDFVGITTTTVNVNEAYRVAEYLRGIWNDALIVFGGVHPTISPQEVLENENVDYVIRGEGERSMAKLVCGEAPENIKGLAVIRDGEYWAHPEVDMIEDLDAMPMPSYHLMPMEKYHPPLGGALRYPTFSLFSARGCPGKCEFCNSAVTKRTRFRSPENVVAEIKYLMDNYGIKEVSFYDDTFIVNPERVRKICRLILDNNIDVTWTCMSRINFADEETLNLMAQAGCHMICYGVESADEQILKTMKKGIKLDRIDGVVRMTQRAGMRARLSFMLGYPGETTETLRKTLQFAIDVDPDLAQFNITTPYPGTALYTRVDRHGYILTHDWSQYDLYTVVMDLPTISPDEIYKFYSYAYRKFYLRPKALVRQLKFFIQNPATLMRSLSDIMELLTTMLR